MKISYHINKTPQLIQINNSINFLKKVPKLNQNITELEIKSKTNPQSGCPNFTSLDAFLSQQNLKPLLQYFLTLYILQVLVQKMASNSEQFLQFLNLAREYPAYFVPLLQKQINSFVNDREMPLAEGVLYQTNQGKTAWVEARNFILSQKPLPPFVKHSGLCKSAADHKNDLCQHGIFGHRGSDGSSFSQRILKHCKKGPGAMAEIIGADFDIKDRNAAEMTILSLIIDDGVKDRGHRKTIFSPTYRYVGWSTGKQDQKNITVFNLTENNLQTFFGGNTNENSFCGVMPSEVAKHQTPFRTSTNVKPQKGSSTWERGVEAVRDITNNTYPIAHSNSKAEQRSNGFSASCGSSSGSDYSKFGLRKGKKVTQKRENTKTFYEEGAKVIETTTKLIYNDGSVEENTDRRTIYMDE